MSLPDPAVKGAKVGRAGPTAGHDMVSSDLKWSGKDGLVDPKVTVEYVVVIHDGFALTDRHGCCAFKLVIGLTVPLELMLVMLCTRDVADKSPSLTADRCPSACWSNAAVVDASIDE